MSRSPRTADQTLVRELNTALILDCLRTQGPLSRAELSDATGLNRSTVSSVINQLLSERLVHEIGLQASGVGRPGMLLALDPKAGCAVGVEIGVDFISAVLTDFTAHILRRQRVSSSPEEGQRVIVEHAARLVQEALDEGREAQLRPLGIGLGVPGLVDTARGGVAFAPNLQWHNVPIGELWARRFGLPVFVENEANAAALGEYYFGVANGVQNFIYLSAGVGLGGGIVIDGKLFRGSSGYAGEVGHITMEPGGFPCGCGKRGCWETVVGPRAIVRRAKDLVEEGDVSQLSPLIDKGLNHLDVKVVVEAAHAGDSVARRALEEVGVQLGIGVANLVNTFNPEMVVLGGVLSLASPFLLPAIEETAQEQALAEPYRVVEVAASVHGVDACVMGAVALVLDEILREPML